MRKQTIVLLLLLVLSGSTGLVLFLEQPAPRTDGPELLTEPEIQTETKLQAEPAIFSQSDLRPALFDFPANPDLLQLSTGSKNRSRFPEEMINRRLKTFDKTEGSDTELFRLLKGSGTEPVKLESRWIAPYLFPGRTLPEIRLHIRKNPETGDYQFSGGALEIPYTRFEAGYDAQPGSEEYKATLQWKKSF